MKQQFLQETKQIFSDEIFKFPKVSHEKTYLYLTTILAREYILVGKIFCRVKFLVIKLLFPRHRAVTRELVRQVY